MAEPSEQNLWTRQWRAERIGKARADYRERESAYACLKDKTTDYALSLKMARDVCAQVLALWEASPVDLPTLNAGVPAWPYLVEDMMLEPLHGADLIRYASKVAGYLGSAYSGEPRDIIKALIRENATLRESLHLIGSTSTDPGAREEAQIALGVKALDNQTSSASSTGGVESD